MAEGKPISQYFDRRYYKNAYAGKKSKANVNSPQYPKRMHRPKKPSSNGLPTEEEIDALIFPPHLRQPKTYETDARDDPKREHFRGMELVNRHRYGDDVDILRATFTKTKEEIEHEKFLLILAARKLLNSIFLSLNRVPKHERYVLGGEIRSCCYTILRNSVALKKRFYRKNMLELIDVEIEVLRALYFQASHSYPEWVTPAHLEEVYSEINEVGRLVGGLLKSTVV